MLDPEKTYATEQQPDGSIKIVDDDGEELVIRERTETTTGALATFQPAVPASDPAGESSATGSQSDIVPTLLPIILIIAAVAALCAVVVVIITMKKRK